VFGQNYVSLAPSLRIACFSFFFLGIISVMQALLSSFRDDAFLSYFTVLAVSFSLFTISAGAFFFGAFGACLGLGISFVIQTVILLVRIRECLRLLPSGE
jgi:O-antigen/teichoic acid export membrane protein